MASRHQISDQHERANDTLILTIKNSFLHFADIPSPYLRRVRSESDLSSLQSCSIWSQSTEASLSGAPSRLHTTFDDVEDDGDRADDDGRDQAPTDEGGDLTLSMKLKHAEGTCTPCKYFNASMGCAYGDECNYCHASHRRPRVRPSKATRRKCKKLVDSIESASDEAMTTLISMAAVKPYLKNILHSRGMLGRIAAAISTPLSPSHVSSRPSSSSFLAHRAPPQLWRSTSSRPLHATWPQPTLETTVFRERTPA